MNLLRWITLVERIAEVGPIKRISELLPLGRSANGRPKFRFIDNVEKDIRSFGIKNLTTVAQNR